METAKILSWVRVADVNDANARKAISLDFRHFEDALQVVSAHACRASCIVTRNAADFLKSGLTVFAPRQFTERLVAVLVQGGYPKFLLGQTHSEFGC